MGLRQLHTLSASLLFCILLLTLPPRSLARTWRVPSECFTIKAGLDSANSGDTVMVAPGTYLETIDPETWIRPGPDEHLVSEDGPETTIIEVCDTGIGIVFFECERASVSGFTVRPGSGPDCGHPPSLTKGVSCYDCTNVVVEDCIIEDFNYGIYIEGASSKWWLPAFRNNIIRSCPFGICCYETIEVGSPFFENNVITDCNYGTWFYDSCPMLCGNEITYCHFFGLWYAGHCGGNCDMNIIAHNDSIGVWVYADPPLAAPSFNGGGVLWAANDFHDNGGPHISYSHSAGPGFLVAGYNYWGSDCPDFSAILEGEVVYSPWVDSTHTQGFDEDDCPETIEPTTWGSIKAMFR